MQSFTQEDTHWSCMHSFGKKLRMGIWGDMLYTFGGCIVGQLHLRKPLAFSGEKHGIKRDPVFGAIVFKNLAVIQSYWGRL